MQYLIKDDIWSKQTPPLFGSFVRHCAKLEFTVPEEEKTKDAVIEVKTVEEKIGQSTSRYTLDKEIVHENDNLSSRKIVYENDDTVANDHVIQLPALEKRVNVIDIEDEDDSDTEDYLPLKKMLSVWSQNWEERSMFFHKHL